MQPSIHIKKIKDRCFDYSVSIPAGAASYTREGLQSIAECLHDAASALGINFKHASVVYGGAMLGIWLVAAMEHETQAVATALQALLSEQRQSAASAVES